MYLKLLFVFFITLTTLQLHARAQVMGYLKKDLDYFKYKDTRLAFGLWIDQLAQEKDVQLIIKYYNDPKVALQEYKEHKIDSYSLNVVYYLKNMKEYDALSQQYWGMLNKNNVPEDLIILVSANSNIKTIKDLKNKIIARKSDDLLAQLFLDKELLSSVHHISRGYINHYYLLEKDSTAILKTFFHKADACIVPSAALNMAAELNPIIKKRLRILKTSPNIYFPGLMIIHSNTPKYLIQKFRRSIANLDKTVKGRNIKALFKITNFAPVSPANMDVLRNFYLNYLQLKAKYKNE